MINKQRILAYLIDTKEPNTAVDIHESTRINLKSVRQSLTTLKKEGKVYRPKWGFYLIADEWRNQSLLRQRSIGGIVRELDKSPYRKCTQCATTKPRADYYPNSRGTGINQPCKECYKAKWIAKRYGSAPEILYCPKKNRPWYLRDDR